MSLTKNIEPIRTEYKGVVFRSKAEAVFARALDLIPFKEIVWCYEPSGVGHPWDFEVWISEPSLCSGCGCMTLDKESRLFIEYKPAEPTRTYWENLVDKCRTFVPDYSRTDSYLVYGNPWSDNRYFGNCYVCVPVFSRFHHEYGWGNFIPEADNGEDFLYSHCHPIERVLGLNLEIAEKAKRHRFDLKSHSA